MKHEREDDETYEYVFQAVPIYLYKCDRRSYPWPKSNHCAFCLVGKMKIVKGTSTLICNTCKGEFHIPHTA